MAIFFTSCGDSSAARPSEAVDTTTAEAAAPINMRDQRPSSRLGWLISTSPKWADGFMGVPPHALYKPTHRRAMSTCGLCKSVNAESRSLDREFAEISIVVFFWKTVLQIGIKRSGHAGPSLAGLFIRGAVFYEITDQCFVGNSDQVNTSFHSHKADPLGSRRSERCCQVIELGGGQFHCRQSVDR